MTYRIVAIAAAIALSACGRSDPPPQVVYQPAPQVVQQPQQPTVIIQQVPAQQQGMSPLTAGLIGAAAGAVVTNQINKAAQQPAPLPAPAAVQQPAVAPVPVPPAPVVKPAPAAKPAPAPVPAAKPIQLAKPAQVAKPVFTPSTTKKADDKPKK